MSFSMPRPMAAWAKSTVASFPSANAATLRQLPFPRRPKNSRREQTLQSSAWTATREQRRCDRIVAMLRIDSNSVRKGHVPSICQPGLSNLRNVSQPLEPRADVANSTSSSAGSCPSVCLKRIIVVGLACSRRLSIRLKLDPSRAQQTTVPSFPSMPKWSATSSSAFGQETVPSSEVGLFEDSGAAKRKIKSDRS